ncbi:putative matrix metalloproteinase-14 [Apostichopus japonicus]|uniref:Putative matrix metalloproteinase-14 n=1 Tax=Stichopus japonicus TaxID=307972 RepID=A0A2G8KWU0_STIJA|nr:putative matrix metalloproteinase-14 [Apostichopus japonicus]
MYHVPGFLMSVPAVTPPERFPGCFRSVYGRLPQQPAYLSQFDYLPASPVSLVDEYDDDADLEASLREPLRIFQRFFRLQETGEMNEESIQAIKRPRCGLGDPPPSDQNESRRGKRYALSGARWGKQELTFSVINTPTYNVMPRKKVNWAIWNALKMWSSVIPVSFRKVPSWQPADIVIKFASYYHGDSYPFDGPNGTIAHAYLPNGRFGDLDGDIHLDDSEAFNNHGRWGYNLYKVLAHEFGHSLGLDHSAVPGSIMVPDYQGFSEKPFTLHSDDIRAVQVLYGFYDTTVQTSKKTCDKAYDATVMISGRLHIFRNNRVWMINKSGKLKTKALGMRSKKLFAGIPSSIDGGYQRPSDGNTVIFKDMQYYVYSGSNQLNGYPRPVADYSLTTVVDAILHLREYNKTYFFKDDQVWRFDENSYSMDVGYPHATTSVFTGIVPPISNAFQYFDGYSYFVTDKQYQRYNPYHRNADPGYPRYFSQDFMKC